MKQDISASTATGDRSATLPNEVSEVARRLRAAFGPSVKLLRVTGAVELGNLKWDAYCLEVDGEKTGRKV